MKLHDENSDGDPLVPTSQELCDLNGGENMADRRRRNEHQLCLLHHEHLSVLGADRGYFLIPLAVGRFI